MKVFIKLNTETLNTGVLMLKMIKFSLMLLIYLSITACANIKTQQSNSGKVAQWDFDHHVQFIQIELASNHYQLEIIPNNKVNFEQLATILLRKSYRLCQHYHYKLEIVQGIEGFDDKLAMPNYIFPSLVAKVSC